MRNRSSFLAAATIAACAGVLAAAGPASASRAGCVAAARGARVVVEDSRGLVYIRHGRARSCYFGSGRISALQGQGRRALPFNGQLLAGTAAVDPSWVRMAGRFVAYEVRFTSDKAVSSIDGPYTTVRVISFDTRSGRTRYSAGFSDSTGPFVDALVVKPNGSVAWMYGHSHRDLEDYTTVVKMDTMTGGEEHGLDGDDIHPHGYTIEPGSLGLSSSGTRIYWHASSADVPKQRNLSAPLQ